MIIILILILILILIILISIKKYNRMKKVSIETVYELQENCKTLYKSIQLKNLFKKYPKKVSGLNFGYICPGAMKTIEYLNKHSNKIDNKLLKNIIVLTDFQFFIEIFVIYKDYIEEEIYRNIRGILKNKSCEISKTITNEISHLFGLLPKNIKNNLPDDFYHIRHNTLICSRNKELANERIQLLKSIYGSIESFSNRNNIFTKCQGKKDGESGCRNCCNSYFTGGNYSTCVKSCMDF
jgi:hypothetical protein